MAESPMFALLRIPLFVVVVVVLTGLLATPLRHAAARLQSPQTVQTDLGADTPEQPRHIFLAGYRAFQADKLDEAQRSFTRALEVYPILADYSLYYLGTIAVQTGNSAQARPLFQRLLTEHPASPWRGQAALALAERAYEQQDWKEAIRYADQARSSSSPEDTRHNATLLSAQAQEHKGNTRKAYYLYQQLRRNASFSAAGKAAKTHVSQLRTRLGQFRVHEAKDAHAYVEEIQLLAREGDGAGIEALSRQLTQRFALTTLSSKDLQGLAKVYKSQGRIEDASAALKIVTRRSPKSPQALYDWARLLWNADHDHDARPLFEQLTKQFPRHGLAAEAWYAIGRIYQAHDDETRAVQAYQQLAKRFPNTGLARDAQWRQGWMAYQRGDFRQAESQFSTLARRARGTPEGESGLYWQARSLERQGKHQDANGVYRQLLERYSHSYYALWAERRLGRAPQPLPLGPALTATRPKLSAKLARSYERSQELRKVGLIDFARHELDRLKQAAPRSRTFRHFLLVEYNRLEGHGQALRLAQGLNQTQRRRYDFPRAHWDTLTEHTSARQLDPYLVLALIRQESLFDPEAVSPARAYGLMQLLPSTAASVAIVPSGEGLPLTDAAFNIKLGTTYLRQLLDRYQNNLIMAVAAYNAGETAVEKWQARFPNAEPDEFVENISYRETRNYVKKVLSNYRIYVRLYEPRPAAIRLGPAI